MPPRSIGARASFLPGACGLWLTTTVRGRAQAWSIDLLAVPPLW
jgi:hypothetical protein